MLFGEIQRVPRQKTKGQFVSVSSMSNASVGPKIDKGDGLMYNDGQLPVFVFDATVCVAGSDDES